MYLTDFHIHSTFSDGKLPIPKIVDLYGTHGFGAIAITDHICESDRWLGKMARLIKRTLTPATYSIYREILKSEAERAWDQYRMVILPGFELTQNTLTNLRSAHILGIGVSEFIPADGEVESRCRAIREKGGLAVAAHPVPTGKWEKQTYLLWQRREELAEDFDAWEVAAGSRLFKEVLVSDLPKLANSDFHSLKHFSSWKTVLDCERHPEAILDAIRNQEVEFRFFKGEKLHDDLHSAIKSLGAIRSPDVRGNFLGLEAL